VSDGRPAVFSDFPEVPEDLIAQSPSLRRDAARLLVLRRKDGGIEHRVFSDVPDYFSPGDALVLNDARVVPARLAARKPTGGRVTLLLLKRFPPEAGGERWTSLVTPKPKPGLRLVLSDGTAAVVRGPAADGEHEILFERSIAADLERLGRPPLPPYIAAPPTAEADQRDREYYQTVYAADAPPPEDGRPHAPGAVAAPTAGLHFTPALLDALRARGVHVLFLTLRVGWGTFRPIAADYRDHRMLPEEFALPEATAEVVNETRRRGSAVWACGTTAVRVLESQADDAGRLRPGSGETGLYITPGHRFRIVDRLLTNFHMPRHTPLLLAAAFAGVDLLGHSYRQAIERRYRFMSYGDAMAIL